tara:strand:- start:384 stop:998 length:615 start_codon:yes stop_codon:yes gene_type:complete
MATTRNSGDRDGGNNLKKTYTGSKSSTDHAAIYTGKIHQNSDVISDFAVLCSDGEHFMSMDKDGQRPGWTTFMGPGCFQVECGSNREKTQDAVMINAKNGNIDIVAKNGKIRLQANDIELIAVGEDTAEGNIKLKASENITGDAKKIIMNSVNNTKMMSSGICEAIGNSGLTLYGNIISGVSDAVAVKDSKVGGQRYQKKQNKV